MIRSLSKKISWVVVALMLGMVIKSSAKAQDDEDPTWDLFESTVQSALQDHCSCDSADVAKFESCLNKQAAKLTANPAKPKGKEKGASSALGLAKYIGKSEKALKASVTSTIELLVADCEFPEDPGEGEGEE